MPYKDPEKRRTMQRKYSSNWYLKNRESQIRKNKIHKRRRKDIWELYKSKQACSHCGFSHPAVIDFHHVIHKNKRSVNILAVVQNNIDEAIREAETKCIPLCSNCHRILHWKEHKVRRKIDKKKSSG